MPGETSRLNGHLGGRPHGMETAETKMRRELQRRWLEDVHKVADQVFNAHLDLALGQYVETDTSEGPIRAYRQPPDARALQWIMEHVWGRARQSIDIETEIKTTDGSGLSEEEKKIIKQALQYALPLR